MTDTFAVDSSSRDLLFDSLSHDIQQIRRLDNELDTLNKNILASGSTIAKSNALSQKEKEVISLIEQTVSKFTELARCSIDELVFKIRAERLKSDFQRVIQRFQRTQAEIKHRLLTESRQTGPPVGDLIDFQSGGGVGRNDGDDDIILAGGIGQTQIMKHSVGDVQQLGFTLQQEAEMQSLEEDIINVNVIFEQLSTLVYGQREAIDSIEDNVEAGYINQESGTSQLLKASTSRQRSRKRCCICSSILVVVITVTILVLVIIYSPRSNH